MHQLHMTHRFLCQHRFYPLLLSSLLACTLYAGRVVLSGSWGYRFLIWNLFLAWLPYAWSLWAATIYRRDPRAWVRLLLPAALWLLFFPNAPYIMTDFVHFPGMRFVWWYDVAFLASFAWAGCFLAVASLQVMQGLVRALLGTVLSWLFVLASVVLSGLGIYLGRFLRWNSWDLFLDPTAVLHDLFIRLANPLDNLRMIGVTAVFAAILLVCYLTFTSGHPVYASREQRLR